MMIPANLPSKHTLTVVEAADFAGVSDDTIRRWCVIHGIGWRPGGRGHWRISSLALTILLANDQRAMAALRDGLVNDPALKRYSHGPRVERFGQSGSV